MKTTRLKQKSRINNADKMIILFWCLFLLIRLFVVDSDNLSASYKSALIVPYIDANNSFIVILLSVIVILFLLLKNRFNVDNNIVLFVSRIVLYFIPCLYVTGDFKFGVAIAMCQTVFAYYIGINYSGKIDYIIKALIFASVILGVQIIAVLALRKISVFDTQEIKYFMRLPMGQTNALGAFIVITYIVVDTFYANIHKKIKYIYFLFLLICLCATGTRSGILVLFLYYFYKFIKFIKNGEKLDRTKLNRISLLFVIFCIVAIFVTIKYGNKVVAMINRFTLEGMSSARFKVYAEVIEYIKQYPIFGRSAYYYYAFDAVKAHNFVLESLIQTGIIGTVLYLLLLKKVYSAVSRIKDKKIKKTFKIFIIFYLIHGLVEPNLFSVTLDTFFWLFAGIGVGYYYRQNKKMVYQRKNLELPVKKADSVKTIVSV